MNRITPAVARRRSIRRDPLRSLGRRMPGIVWTVDLQLRFSTCDGEQSGRESLFPNGAASGSSLQAAFPPDHAGVSVHRDALAGRSGGFEIRRGERSFACRVEPFRDAFGSVVGAVAAAVEVTGLRRNAETDRRRQTELERRIVERTGQLLAALREIDVLCHAIAHDLRSPLRTIASGAQILLENGSGLGDEARDWARRIAAAANRMDALVLGLLDYSGRSSQETELQTVDLDRLIRELLARMAFSVTEAKAKVTVDGVLPPVRAQVRSLDYAVAGLLSNALKFVREGVPPRIRFRAERCGSAVRLWVDDNGLGIAPEHQQRIFGVFERLQRRERFEGAGIGLAIARRLVERMGGAIGVRSEPGRGSSFYLDLPGA